jgi:hypothetical protein
MRFLDKLALNRLISIILSFILSIIKLVVPKTESDDSIVPKPPTKRKRLFPRGRNE